MLIDILTFINWFILWFFILLSLGYIILLTASIPDIIARFQECEIGNINTLLKSNSLPPVTMLVPAYNEEDNITETIDSLLKSKYSNTHIIVINAGSTDGTLQKLIETYHLEKVTPIIQSKVKTSDTCRGYYISPVFRNFTLIDKANRDKSDALNMGLNACQTPLFITVDADTLVEPDAISAIVFHLLSYSNAVAVGGAVYVLNGCTFNSGQMIEERMSHQPLHAFQICEYLRSFLFNRSGWNYLGGSLCYAGAFTLFRTQPIIEIGGFDPYNLSQDFEIITHLHADQRENNNDYQIKYNPSAAVWTDVPSTLKSYWRQRYNWQYYTLDSLFKHIYMCFNPKYGIVGMFTFPFYLFGEVLGAFVELMAYGTILLSWYLGTLSWYWALMFFTVCWGFSIFLTMATALMNFITFNKYRRMSDVLRIFLYSIIEAFGFRQFSVVCRVIATFQFFMDKLKFWTWHKQKVASH